MPLTEIYMSNAQNSQTSSLPVQTDFHKNGIYVAFAPGRVMLEETCATTAYSARAKAVRLLNKSWRHLEELGHELVELIPVARVCAERQMPPGDDQIESLVVNWELYSSMPQAQKAAEHLTEALKVELRCAKEENDFSLERAKAIRERLYALMNQFEKLGARDTEPEVALVTALDQFFPEHAPLSR